MITKNIIALGDLHGDLPHTLNILRKAKLIDKQQDWIGGDAILVQVGDQIDRGAWDKEVIDLFETLTTQARQSGGEVHALLGDHETMNVEGSFYYVFPDEAFLGFAQYTSPAPGNYVEKYPHHQRGRVHAFYPGGKYARILSQRKVVVKIGPYVFVHGGILPYYARYGVERLNDEVSQWMKGSIKIPSWVNDSNGPLWARHFSYGTGSEECRLLEETLAMLDARIMFVGHTVQEGGINSCCNGRVVRLDTGISSCYGGLQEALLIRNGQFSVVR